ncbi:MAG: TIR domain-containing protein [Planctomycetota bacterium]|nr:TIR domain-containing protein [Planctomycetota bacterium]
MAIVPGFENDLFISYAHIDNSELIPGRPESRWITALRNSLQILVNQKLGGSPVQIWRDLNDLHGNASVTPEIQQAIQSTALLVVIMTQAVLERPWCRQERELFIAKNAAAGLEGRIFLIHKDDVAREKWPAEFQDLIGYPFFTKDAETGQTETLGVPVPDPTEKDYFRQLERLRSDIASRLIAMRSQANQPRTPVGNQTALGVQVVPSVQVGRDSDQSVFVSEVSADLEDERDNVVQYLRGAGLRVLPDRFYPRAVDEYTREAGRDMAESQVFVQLLGAHATRASEDRTYEGIQCDLARQRFSDEPYRTLLWRSPLVDVSKAKFVDHQQLLDAADVLNEDLEEFKPRVIQALKRTRTQAVTIHGDRFVLIHTGEEDLPIADQVADRIREIAELHYPRFEFGHDIVAGTDLLSVVTEADEYDGLIVLYGETPQAWVHQQVRGLRTLMLKQKQDPPRCAVLLGPPTRREPLRCRPPRVWFVDWDDESQLRGFLDAVTESGPKS